MNKRNLPTTLLSTSSLREYGFCSNRTTIEDQNGYILFLFVCFGFLRLFVLKVLLEYS